jgi:hypothetical protein
VAIPLKEGGAALSMWGHIPRRGKETFEEVISMVFSMGEHLSRGQIITASLARRAAAVLRKRKSVNALR